MNLFNKTASLDNELHSNLPILFELGYEIFDHSTIQQGMTFWRVLLKSTTCFIQIYQDRNEVYLHFAPHNSLIKSEKDFKLTDQVSLYGMIYYLTKGEKIIGTFENDFYRSKKLQYKLISVLLKKYHAQIVPLFTSSSFWVFKPDLFLAGKEYEKFIFKRYVLDQRPRERFSFEDIFINIEKD